jgi:branched-chain amino acid transport system substrate-binding protein
MDRRTFLSLAAATAVAGPTLAQPKEKVKIVSSLPRVGGTKWQTDQIALAIQMAISDFEKTTPFAVEYLDRDDASPRLGTWDERTETEITEKAIADKDVVAFIGPYNSGAARVSAPLLNAAGLVQLAPSASLPGLTRKSPSSDPDEPEKYRPSKKITFCRVCPNDASQGPVSAEFAANELKVKSVYILDDKELSGYSLAMGFKKKLEDLKIKVVGHDHVDPLSRDLSKLMQKIKKTEPDLVYFGGTRQTGGAQVVKDAFGEKLTCPLLLSEGCYEQGLIDVVGADTFDALKCFVAVSGLDPAQLKGAGAEFVKRFKEQHKRNATATTIYAYEAAAVVLEALRAVGKKDREAVRAAVVGTKNFDKGLLGKWSFDENGDNTLQPLTIATVEKGKFKAVKMLGVN